ncbi:MAG: dicarboxylate/amino acid:cation symporter [Planctomycetes bacterium]|nr:dicarboxylate/amino acid:cation symporter [Planctomycetota bacterium]MBL7009479.1 dicarboxylate/amino acid:cation symporter [Planctomycetota bacterium]
MLLGVVAGLGLQLLTEVSWLKEVSRAGVETLKMDPECQRAEWIAPLAVVADIFMRLLKMLIVPLILTSIVSGVTSISGGAEFGRLGLKTLVYYMTTSLLAIFAGLTMVNLFQPGTGAELGLEVPDAFAAAQGASFVDVLQNMVPPNVFAALGDNRGMLQVIVFALIFGFFIGRTPAPHGPRVRELFQSLFEVMMRVAEGVLTLVPYGVFALVAKVVGETGIEVFKPLAFFMAIVFGTLLFHAAVVLPLLLWIVGRISPLQWFKAMAPALMTAFTTSSSSMTLPVSMESCEHRGKVSNKITSFVLPLGATINMDGTALYECVGVIFLSQYYASHNPALELTLAMQFFVVVTALLASVGAAGIPSAGLVLKATILKALGLPDDGVLLLLAIDRPLDMMRTAVNVWSDSCGAALIAKSEGDPVLQAGPPCENPPPSAPDPPPPATPPV